MLGRTLDCRVKQLEQELDMIKQSFGVLAMKVCNSISYHGYHGNPHLQVAKMEQYSMSCERWVCLHGNSRLEVGDTWREGRSLCHCRHVSKVETCCNDNMVVIV